MKDVPKKDLKAKAESAMKRSAQEMSKGGSRSRSKSKDSKSKRKAGRHPT